LTDVDIFEGPNRKKFKVKETNWKQQIRWRTKDLIKLITVLEKIETWPMFIWTLNPTLWHVDISMHGDKCSDVAVDSMWKKIWQAQDSW